MSFRTPRPALRSASSFLARLALCLPALYLAPALPAQQALILSDPSRGTIADAAVALEDMLAGQGLDVQVLDIVPVRDPGPLDDYACVWDLRVDIPLSVDEEARFAAYAGQGGGLYLAGENSSFLNRTFSIGGFLESLGSGPLPADTTPAGPRPRDIIEEANPDHFVNGGCDPVRTVVHDGVDNGHLRSAGTGTWLTGSSARPSAVAFDRGSLPAAPDARALVVLDINYLSPGVNGTLDFRVQDRTLPTENRYFVGNAIRWLCFGEGPDPAPPEDCACAPRNHGFWHRWCLGTGTIDPGRHGGGMGPDPSPAHLMFEPDLFERADARMARYGIGVCQALDEGPFSDPRRAALREMATLQLNLQAGLLQRGCPVELRPLRDDTGLLVVDALDLLDRILRNGTGGTLREARWIGGHIANREALR